MPSCSSRTRAPCRLWSTPASRRTASCTSVYPAPPSKTSRSVRRHTDAPICSCFSLFISQTCGWGFTLGLCASCSLFAESCLLCVRQVQIRPWNLNDSDFVMDGSQPLDPRKTIFVGGVPRPLRAGVLHFYVDLCMWLVFPSGESTTNAGVQWQHLDLKCTLCMQVFFSVIYQRPLKYFFYRAVFHSYSLL